jgi:hypothetical protein
MVATTRRDMFGGVFGELARVAGDRFAWLPVEPRHADPLPPSESAELEPAARTSAVVSDEGLLELAEGCDLNELAEQVQGLSVRGSRLHPELGAPQPPGRLRPPAEVTVDLTTLPRHLPLLDAGALRVEVDPDALTGNQGPVEVAVALVSESAAPRLLACPELTLPRAWSAPVQALGLRPDQLERWEELRRRLAAAQGVELTDHPARPFSIHRLLGYPDEQTGEMPVWCELREQGIDLGGEPVFMHPLAQQVGAEARRWRLLLQISRDARLGWRWGTGFERLYVWIPATDLRSGRLDRVRALIR